MQFFYPIIFLLVAFSQLSDARLKWPTARRHNAPPTTPITTTMNPLLVRLAEANNGHGNSNGNRDGTRAPPNTPTHGGRFGK